ncbi:hypothetical protein [Nocardia grenadensis]|uniref:hypothetical protein n=1 Tax=Nocardia grenadensis TaxID=931537 RepID=UPI003D713146
MKFSALLYSVDNFELLDVPAVVARETAGHNGPTYGRDVGDSSGPMLIADYTMVTDWFDYTLHGNDEVRAQFAGESCGLCTRPVKIRPSRAPRFAEVVGYLSRISASQGFRSTVRSRATA